MKINQKKIFSGIKNVNLFLHTGFDLITSMTGMIHILINPSCCVQASITLCSVLIFYDPHTEYDGSSSERVTPFPGVFGLHVSAQWSGGSPRSTGSAVQQMAAAAGSQLRRCLVAAGS